MNLSSSIKLLIILSMVQVISSKKISSAKTAKKSRNNLLLTKESFQPVPSESQALGRYAFTYQNNNNNNLESGSNNTSTSTNSTTDMAATAIGDIMSHIRDPFKHGVTAALLAGLYIIALIALIVFATSGTLAFICSFIDCRNFFMGMKPESPRRRWNHYADVISSKELLWYDDWQDKLPEMFREIEI